MQNQIHLSELAEVDITTVNKEDLVTCPGWPSITRFRENSELRRFSVKLKIHTVSGWAIWG